MISVENLSLYFGGIRAVDDVSLEIGRGSITGLIGPNGAGKTTLFNVIAGVLKPSSGSVYLDGENVTGLEPYELFAKGLTFSQIEEMHERGARFKTTTLSDEFTFDDYWPFQKLEYTALAVE